MIEWFGSNRSGASARYHARRLAVGAALVVGVAFLVAAAAQVILPILLTTGAVIALWFAGDALIALAKDATLEAKGWRKS